MTFRRKPLQLLKNMTKCKWLNLNYYFNIVIQLFTCVNETNYKKNKFIYSTQIYFVYEKKIICRGVQMIAELYIDYRTIFLFCAR